MLRIKKEPAVTVLIKAEIAHFESTDEKRPVTLADAPRHLHIGYQVSIVQIILGWIICRFTLGAMQLRQHYHRLTQGARALSCVGGAAHTPQDRMHVRTRELRVDDAGVVELHRRAYAVTQATQKQRVGIFTAGFLHAQRVQPVACRVVTPAKYLVKPTCRRRDP